MADTDTVVETEDQGGQPRHLRVDPEVWRVFTAVCRVRGKRIGDTATDAMRTWLHANTGKTVEELRGLL